MEENKDGLANAQTVFYYSQSGDVISGEYRGGLVLEGRFVGKMTGKNGLKILFQCLSEERKLLSGKASGTIHVESDGRLGLSFEWEWLSGAEGNGVSSYRELESQ